VLAVSTPGNRMYGADLGVQRTVQAANLPMPHFHFAIRGGGGEARSIRAGNQ